MAEKALIGYDLVIIGAGPAGLSAALYAARQRLRFVLISKDVGGMANFIPEIETYLGHHYLSGYDLVRRFQEHLEDYGVKINDGEEVREIKRAGGAFVVSTDKADYSCRTIIIASGRGFKRLNVPGEAKYSSKAVSYCAACDAPLFKGKTVAIIGGGFSGLLSTLYTNKLFEKIYLIEIRPYIKEIPEIVDAVKALKNVEIMTSTKTLKILGEKSVSGLKIERNGRIQDLKVDAVFVEIGYNPNIEFVSSLIRLNDKSEIIVDANEMTSVPGIFAAGDITSTKAKGVVIAVGDGARAALSATEWLTENNRR